VRSGIAADTVSHDESALPARYLFCQSRPFNFKTEFLYLFVSYQIKFRKVDRIKFHIRSPARLIASNAGVEGEVIVEALSGQPFEMGYNAMDDRIEVRPPPPSPRDAAHLSTRQPQTT